MKPFSLVFAFGLVALSASGCHATVVDDVDAPQGSFAQDYEGTAPPFAPVDGFAVQAPDGYVTLVFSDADYDSCRDGFDPGTSRLELLVPPWALTSPGSHSVDAMVDTVDAACRNVRPAWDAATFASVSIDAIGGGAVRGSYHYEFRGTLVHGTFEVPFCGAHPAGDDLACHW